LAVKKEHQSILKKLSVKEVFSKKSKKKKFPEVRLWELDK
jgi:hypothetical protein